MILIRYTYKILKKLSVIKFLEYLFLISIRVDKHELEYVNKKCLIRIFAGTYGGYSILVYNYYINISGRLFICNYKKILNFKNINLNKIGFNSSLEYIMPLALLESILLEEDLPKYKVIKYPILLNSAKYVQLRKKKGKSDLVINKAGGFWHFCIEVIPILLSHIEKDYNIYFIIEDKPFYKSILGFYNLEYDTNCDSLNNKTSIIDMPRYYPDSNEIIKLYKYNCETFQIPYQSTRKIYVTRRNEKTRRVFNEESLINELLKLGFEVIDSGKLEYWDQIKYFRNAEIIVAPHGAAFGNIVWCRKDVKIIELNADVDTKWQIAKMAIALNFKHKLLICKSLNNVYFEVDIPLVIKSINESWD